MPKANSVSSLSIDQRIGLIVQSAAHEIAALIRADVARQVVALIRGRASSSSSRSPSIHRTNSVATSGKRTYPPHCLHPNCSRPHKGPRFSFLCENHLNASKADKRRFQETWRNGHQNGRANGKANGVRANGVAKVNGRQARPAKKTTRKAA